MGYFSKQKTASVPTKKQKDLVEDAYHYLEEGGVKKTNVAVFLLAIRGIAEIQICEAEGQSITLSQWEKNKLHQYFDIFFRNKLVNT